jgi:hypothetical protein
MRRVVATAAAAFACLIAAVPLAPAQDTGEAPETFITSGPTVTSDTTATFTFLSTTEGATFECHVDFTTGFLPCSSPLTLRDVRPGVHVLSVRAVAGGVPDPSPALHYFGIAPPCRGLAPTMVVTEDRKSVRGTNGTDVIVVIGGNSEIDARGGNDLICAHVGEHNIDGGGGNDYVKASPEGGVVQGRSGGDFIRGDDGRDLIAGGGGRDRLLGGEGGDFIDGGSDRDRLMGGNGFDRCDGGLDEDRAASCEVETAVP